MLLRKTCVCVCDVMMIWYVTCITHKKMICDDVSFKLRGGRTISSALNNNYNQFELTIALQYQKK